MSGYRLYAATSGPSSSAADSGQYVMGLSFVLSENGHSLYGYWWWVADAEQSTGAQEFGLWTPAGEHTGDFVSGSEATSGTMSLGWNYVALGSPISLSGSQEYVAATAVPGTADTNGYSSTTGYFTSGGPAENGITVGPLLAYSGSGGTSNVEPVNGAQMGYDEGGTDPTADFPIQNGDSSNYWLDIQIDSPSGPPGPAPTVLYSMRMFP